MGELIINSAPWLALFVAWAGGLVLGSALTTFLYKRQGLLK